MNTENAPVRLSDAEIFTRIWTEPKRIFTYIYESGYSRYFTLIIVLAGISSTFDRAAQRNLGDRFSLEMILLVCILAGGLLGWISFYLYAALLRWTGSWLGARDLPIQAIFRMLGYASLPTSVALILLVPQVGIYGNAVFQADSDLFSAGFMANLSFYMSVLAEVFLAFWSLALMLVGLSVFQDLTIWKAALNLLLPFLIIVLPLMLIAMLLF